jgi:spore coat polysaccharide biosynthesis protein SpsF
MQKSKVAIVLTARSTSERLPNKVMQEVEGKPLIYWIAKQLDEAGHVILAVPYKDKLAEWGKSEGIPTFEGSSFDVMKRIVDAATEHVPSCHFIMRGLGDCPFPSVPFIKRSVEVMRENNAEAFSWALPPFAYTVYGATEFPRKKELWERMNIEGTNDEREHPDLFYHRHRDSINIVYHEPPAPKYFRPYRLEVDWKEDMEMIRAIAKSFGRLPTLEEALDYLDKHDDWRINSRRIEKTGLSVSYSQTNRSMWWKAMVGKPIVCWNNLKIDVPKETQPVYCRAKTCFLGVTDGDNLYRPDGVVIAGKAYVTCACGSGRSWQNRS